jgi:catechol-2,3-dioxygenase
MRDADGTLGIALRYEPERAAALSGFDPVAIGVPTRRDLDEWRRRLDDLGRAHGGVVQGHQGWALIGLTDPDGLEIRLYTLQRHDGGATA